MLNIPILRWGTPYTSLETDDVVQFRTGETLARVSQANTGLLKGFQADLFRQGHHLCKGLCRNVALWLDQQQLLAAHDFDLAEHACVGEVPRSVGEITDVELVRQRYAVELHGKAGTTAEQGKHCLGIIRKPAPDAQRYARVWQDQVLPLADAYQMAE